MVKIIKACDIFTILTCFLIISLFIINIENSFFWDTIQLGSKQANFYLSVNFSSFLLPNDIDSGHIPAFGYYLGLVWKIFGRNLFVSHLAVFPFVLGILWQAQILVRWLVPKKFVGLAMCLILLDPSLLSQMTLVSPDVPLVFFFLLALNGICRNRKYAIVVGIMFLFLVSLRGMMISICLLFIDLYWNINYKVAFKTLIRQFVRRSLLYLPALLIFLLYAWYHIHATGWIGFHSESPWAGSFARTDFKGLIYNVFVLGWRIIDFGRIGVWIVMLILFMHLRNQMTEKPKARLLLFSFLTLLIFLPANMLWAKHLVGHRYLLPIILAFSALVVFHLFSNSVRPRVRHPLVILWMTFLLTGNLWIYPPKVSQGWDATLAHLPYYQLRKSTMNYLNAKQISFKDVHSFFPNTSSIDMIDLNGDSRSFGKFDGTSEYVFYSNVYNISDDQYNSLHNEYGSVYKICRFRICVNIYKRKKER